MNNPNQTQNPNNPELADRDARLQAAANQIAHLQLSQPGQYDLLGLTAAEVRALEARNTSSRSDLGDEVPGEVPYPTRAAQSHPGDDEIPGEFGRF